MTTSEKLRRFFEDKYLNTPNLRGGIIEQEDIECMLTIAEADDVEQDMLDYSESHPDAVFWDFCMFMKVGILNGVTQEELLADDE